MTVIQEKLFALQDKEYAKFQANLTPGIPLDSFIGVRVPRVRELAKEIKKEEYVKEFLNTLPHKYYDENMLHAVLISEMKDYIEIIEYLDKFLPYVDNWAVCDIMSPKTLSKYKGLLINKIQEWIDCDKVYTIRFGIEMLMSFYLDDDFDPSYLEMVSKVKSNEYYVNMMIAWFFATSLAKQWDATIPYIEKGILDRWTNNKTIQKARESYRITNEQKEYLNTLKK